MFHAGKFPGVIFAVKEGAGSTRYTQIRHIQKPDIFHVNQCDGAI